MECQATFSPKQLEYLQYATHRWNFKTGATRSGKTHLDYKFVIPKRIFKLPPEALIMILGNTSNSVERNVLRPMRNIYGDSLVGDVKPNKNTVQLFGREVMVMGADRISQVPKLQGAGIDYCYGDEVATWNKAVFDMLKSRLDKEHSCFDGTCNPEFPSHWLKEFLDSDADIYHQHYTIDDNPFLPAKFVEELKKEYMGTVLYRRFILGEWTVAEGLIYQPFADDPEAYMIDVDDEVKKQIDFITIGIDFGGNKSATTFVANGFTKGLKMMIPLMDDKMEIGKGKIDADRLCISFFTFLMKVMDAFKNIRIAGIYCDSEAQYLINSIRNYLRRQGFHLPIGDSKKEKILNRIAVTITLLNSGRLRISRKCTHLPKALETALWSSKDPDKRLDDFTTDIDTIDAYEYSFERYINKLTPFIKGM